ncbi:MAG: AAA family ATPase [Burkholderiales bacterium]|nr:AAA family ATPase [Burkholderiales bacterium]
MVTLVQMPNGTGKTTTLKLLRAALSGPGYRSGWSEEEVAEFRKRSPRSDSGRFELRLLLNDKRVTIILNFDFNANRVSYKTTRGSGQLDGFDPPQEFRRFMNENFVNFFVFDGELAENLLSKAHTDAEAVVESLFQINILKTLSQKVAAYWDDYTQRVSATEERGLSRRRNRLKSLKDRLSQLIKQRDEFLVEKRHTAEQMAKWRNQFERQIKKEKDRAAQIGEARESVQALETSVRRCAVAALDHFREPHALSTIFAESIHDLKLGLDRVKLPESAAREFFEELATEKECVCGRPIDGHISDVIRDRAKRYLGSDDVSLLNAMKTSIDEAVGRSRLEPEKSLNEELLSLDLEGQRLREARNALDMLTIAAEETDPEIKHANQEIHRLELEETRIKGLLDKFDDKDDSLGDEHTCGIGVIERRISDAERKLAEATKTLQLREKRDILATILNAAQERASKQISIEICNEANMHIRTILPHNNISIRKIEKCLVLQGQGGGSAGETLSIGYAFLSTLFDRAEHELPFVVDSPAGPIDLEVRPKIGELVPKLSKQFIAFTISSERERFIPALEKACNDVKYLTVFRKGPAELGRRARAEKDCAETMDGFLVTGKAFFETFQVETEEM